MTTTEAPPVEVVRDSHDDVLAALVTVATECQRLRDIIKYVQQASGVEFARFEMEDQTQKTVDEHGKARVGFTVSIVGGDEKARQLWVGQQFADFFNGLIVENVGRAEKAEKDLQHMLDVGRQEYAEAYAAPIRQALDEERRQRIHEAELAREAIAHVRALIDAIEWRDLIDAIEDEDHGEAHAAARAWLDERAKV